MSRWREANAPTTLQPTQEITDSTCCVPAMNCRIDAVPPALSDFVIQEILHETNACSGRPPSSGPQTPCQYCDDLACRLSHEVAQITFLGILPSLPSIQGRICWSISLSDLKASSQEGKAQSDRLDEDGSMQWQFPAAGFEPPTRDSLEVRVSGC